MAHRTVRAVMTATVATVSLDTPFKGLAAITAEHGVNALPVLDGEGRLAGVVSQTDLIRKEEYQDDPGRGGRRIATTTASRRPPGRPGGDELTRRHDQCGRQHRDSGPHP
jgi:CBS domain-containing protein